MSYQSIEDLPSRYQFVHVVARRARKIQAGARPLLGNVSRKATRVAQAEVMGGLVQFTVPQPEAEQGSEEQQGE